jgi:hypothetical protein
MSEVSRATKRTPLAPYTNFSSFESSRDPCLATDSSVYATSFLASQPEDPVGLPVPLVLSRAVPLLPTRIRDFAKLDSPAS